MIASHPVHTTAERERRRRLRAILKQHHGSVSKLARTIRISQSIVSRWLQGDDGVLSQASVQSLYEHAEAMAAELEAQEAARDNAA